MQTIKLLTEARQKLGVTSDGALADYLSVSHAAVGHWRTGFRLPDATQCAKIAVLIGLEPLEVIAAIESQRAKRIAENATFWRRYMPKVREFIFSLACRSVRNNQA